MLKREYLGKYISAVSASILLILTIAVDASLLWNETRLFTYFNHTIGEFIFSSAWNPSDLEQFQVRQEKTRTISINTNASTSIK